MQTRKIAMVLIVAVALTLLLAASFTTAGPPVEEGELGALAPVSTSFTYQGRLNDGGNPANGSYDFEFKLYSAADGGYKVGSTVSKGDVAVSDGLFTVELDFGSDRFTGDARWLEIDVRPGSSTGAYTTLTPRQALTATPYAIYALGAPWSGLTDVPPGFADGVDDTESAHEHWGETWGGSGVGLTLNSSGNVGLQVSGGIRGVYVNSPGADGVKIDSAGQYGVYVDSPGASGVRVDSSPLSGVQIHSPGQYGVYVDSPGQHGVYVDSPGTSGVAVNSPGDDGVQVDSAGRYGVYADTRATYGLYTPDSVYVGGKIDLVGTVDPIIGERFEVDPQGQYQVGDLLVIDPDSPYLVLSSEPDDTKVIGVVGPGVDYEDGELMVIVFGWHGAKPAEDDDENVRAVAKIKADASYGPIKRGDLLTTSPTPGHAMKAQPVDLGGVEIHRPGTIIGKALESLDSGQGLIEVFIVLQ